MKYFIFLIVLHFFQLQSLAQAPNIQWQKSYGGSMNDRGYSICNSPDGGFVIAAYTESNDGDVLLNKGVSDIWLINIDSAGTIIWEKSIGGSKNENVNTIYMTNDNGLIIFGTTRSNDSDVSGLHNHPIFPMWNDDGWLVKVDSIGQIQWQRCYGGTERDEGREMILTSDSGYLLVEEILSNNGDVSNHFDLGDYWIVKVNQSSNIEWEKTFGGMNLDGPKSCTETTDGEYLIAGFSQYDFGGYHGTPGLGSDIGVVKVDSSGNLIWSKCYGGTGADDPFSIIAADNGGFYMVSESNSNDGDLSFFYGGSDCWVFKADRNGSIQWQKSYGGSSYDVPYKIIKTNDGGIVIASTTSSNDVWVTYNHGWDDLWIVKLDSLGNLEWEKSLGGTLEDHAFSILETSDGGFIICGYTLSSDGDVTFNHGGEDVWVVKLSPPGLSVSETENSLMNLLFFQDGNLLNIRFTSKYNEKAQILLFDLEGRKVFENEIVTKQGINYHQFNCSKIVSGMYLIKIDGKDYSQTEKVIFSKN